MKGVNYIADDRGERKSLVLDLAIWGDVWNEFAAQFSSSEGRDLRTTISGFVLNLDPRFQLMLYLAFKSMLLNKETYGYFVHNSDPGHPVYSSGANGNIGDNLGDHPDDNFVFIMLSELSGAIKRSEGTGYTWWYDFSLWRDFCSFLIEHHRATRGY